MKKFDASTKCFLLRVFDHLGPVRASTIGRIRQLDLSGHDGLAVAVDECQVSPLLGALANVFDPRASEWEVGVELGDLIDPALDFTGESPFVHV
ncbi:MAG: hypothetical protein IPH64_01165 [Comamonadaceae bacterium]|nr:hypothetical protein [Comamonadaceae bacterium]